jgi:hypothetical protein
MNNLTNRAPMAAMIAAPIAPDRPDGALGSDDRRIERRIAAPETASSTPGS